MSTRRFELADGSSNKFWEIALDGTSFTVTFGKIGTNGQTQTKTFDSATKAQNEHDKLVKEKTKKGYAETTAAAPPPPAPPPAPAPPPTEGGVAWSPEALREAAPRRGSAIVPLRKPDAKALFARLSTAMKKAGTVIDSGKHVEGADVARATAAQSAYGGATPKTPLDVETEAAAFALVAPKLLWDDTSREEAFVEFWCATEGVAFALRALDAATRVHTVAKNDGRNYDVQQLAIIATEQPTLWWRTRSFDGWRALRRSILGADADRTKLEQVAEAILAAGGRTPIAEAALRATFALGFERSGWVSGDLPSGLAQAPAIWNHARTLLAPSVTEALATIAGSGQHAVWYTIQNLEPIRFDFLHAYGAAIGPLLVPIAREAAIGAAERFRALAETLACVVDEGVAEFFLGALTTKEIRGIASEYLRSHPTVSVARLAEASTRKGPHADAARAVLKGIVATNDPAIAAARPTLGPAALAVLDALAADAAPKVEAALDELPPVLRAPPWNEKRIPRAPIERPLTVPTWDETIAWREGEQTRRALYERRWIDAQNDPTKVSDVLARIQRAHVDGLATSKPAYSRTSATLFLCVPDKTAIKLLRECKLESFDWRYYAVLGALVARHGLDAVEPVLRFAEREPSIAVDALNRVDSPRVAPLMAEALDRLKSRRDVAAEWLASFPRAATAGLLPLATGKEKRARVLAERALRSMAATANRKSMLEAAARCGDGAVEALDELLAFDPLFALPAKLPKLPGWWNAGAFSRPLLRGREKAVPLAAVDAIGISLALSTFDEPYAGIAEIRAACDPRSLADFAWDLFQAWLVAGAPSKEGWAFQALGHFGDDECARRLTPLVRIWPGEAAHARAVVGLDVLAHIGTDVALMHLHGIAQKLKFKGLQEKAREKIDDIAEARGLSAEELGDRLVPDLGLDDDGSLRLDFGARAFRVRFDEALKPSVTDDDGKKLPDLPKAKATDDAEKAKAATETWKALKKDGKTIAQAQLLRLELAMCAERRWSEDVFRPFLLEHPLLIHLVRRLVWGAYDPKSDALRGTFRVAEDASFADARDASYAIPEGSTIGIVHRLALDDATAATWGQVLSDYELIQPFEQLARGVVRPDEAEAKAVSLTRVKGLKVPTGKVLGLDARGWRRGPPQDAGVVCWYEKPIAGGLVVSMDLDPGIYTGLISESPEQTLGELTLTTDGYHKTEGKTFGAIGPIVFSELTRDLESLRG